MSQEIWKQNIEEDNISIMILACRQQKLKVIDPEKYAPGHYVSQYDSLGKLHKEWEIGSPLFHGKDAEDLIKNKEALFFDNELRTVEEEYFYNGRSQLEYHQDMAVQKAEATQSVKKNSLKSFVASNKGDLKKKLGNPTRLELARAILGLAQQKDILSKELSQTETVKKINTIKRYL